MKKIKDYEEKKLLKELSLGNSIAFETIFDRYQGLVYSFAKRLTRSDSLSEEIVQEVFIRIWMGRKKMVEVQNFGAYLNRAVRNQVYNALRQLAIREKAREQMQQDVFFIEEEDAGYIDQEALENLLKKAIDRLTPQQKKVYNLCYQEGYKYQDAAKKLNISSLTVHSHMKIALKTIRTYIGARIDAVFVLLFAFLRK
ncbi:RNA polymerase sigma-70 factor [Olivibacter sp. XZL3]|uniref:RNA polymerase sigma-70 factor n=1 Tax=Olivibacter sp. XZL3 TaxID=1735116 RepID=UPI0010670F24|nr:RNA polymerase sigma-70 factor [Olivibacter sp. XZL3]